MWILTYIDAYWSGYKSAIWDVVALQDKFFKFFKIPNLLRITRVMLWKSTWSDILRPSMPRRTLEFYISKLCTSCRAYKVVCLAKFWHSLILNCVDGRPAKWNFRCVLAGQSRCSFFGFATETCSARYCVVQLWIVYSAKRSNSTDSFRFIHKRHH